MSTRSGPWRWRVVAGMATFTRFSILSFAVLWALGMSACSDERTVEQGEAEESEVQGGVTIPYVITDRPDTIYDHATETVLFPGQITDPS